MTIRVLFLGRLEDAAGSGMRDVPAEPDVAALIASFEPALAALLCSDTVRVAVNGVLGAGPLAAGDEVAFLPPVSGG
ncbi:MAG TPA: MoaD/ThiS family protein [Novosphingobium sp.]|nr:MoaD/ThiS family protein [Novosphingobium sp.]